MGNTDTATKGAAMSTTTATVHTAEQFEALSAATGSIGRIQCTEHLSADEAALLGFAGRMIEVAKWTGTNGAAKACRDAITALDRAAVTLTSARTATAAAQAALDLFTAK